MYMTVAICPGTFDPVTNGHLDVIERAASIFDTVIVSILVNSEKRTLFTTDERLEMLRMACGHLPNVSVDHFEGLLVDYVRARGAHVVVRGLRAVSDFEYELTMALMNRKLDPTVETMYIMASQEYSFLSSSIVKEVARLGGDIRCMVPAALADRIIARCKGEG
jgi:pantetheine-phosphate adenylyltransferase